MDHATTKAITRIEIAAETSNGSELSELIKAITDTTAIGQALRKDVQAKFYRVMAELCVTEDGKVIRGSRIVLPTNLQDRAVKTAHEGHQGRTKTKALMRTKVWFSTMDIKVLIDQCPPCQLSEVVHTTQPMQPSELPSKAWQPIFGDLYQIVTSSWSSKIVNRDSRSYLKSLLRLASM